MLVRKKINKEILVYWFGRVVVEASVCNHMKSNVGRHWVKEWLINLFHNRLLVQYVQEDNTPSVLVMTDTGDRIYIFNQNFSI